MPKGNPNPVGRESANAVLATKYQARVKQARAWLNKPDENGVTRHAVIGKMPMTLWHYAKEYAQVIGCNPRTAKRYLQVTLQDLL